MYYTKKPTKNIDREKATMNHMGKYYSKYIIIEM